MAELVVTSSAGYEMYSGPSFSFRLMASGKFRIHVLVAVTDSSGDIEDDRDTFESLAHGFCSGRDVSVVSTFSYEKRGDYIQT